MRRCAAILGLLAVALTACTGTPAPAPTSSVPAGPADAYPTCPPKAPPEGTLSITGHAKARTLAPGSPQAMTVCRYSRLPDQVLVRSVRVPASRMRSLQALLNALRPSPKGAFGCPLDRGDLDLVLIRYGPTNIVPIKVSLSGCRYAYNRFGQAFATTRRLRAGLAQLVGAGA